MFPNPDDDMLRQPDFADPDALGGNVSEAHKIVQGLLADLPEDAHKLMNKVNREIAGIKDQTDEEIQSARHELDQRVSYIESRADDRRRVLLEHAIEQLEPLQKELFRAGDLGKALATFVQIQALKSRVNNVLSDPGNLLRFQRIGKSFCFRIIGAIQGPVWGSDVYTADSHLATAAVHAGAVEEGEEAVVRVSIVDMAGVPVQGSLSHGVMTMDWGPYPCGYRVVRV